MKLKCSFESVDMGDEIVAVPVGDGADKIHGVLKLNKTGLEIVNMLEYDTTAEDITEKLASKYKNEKSILFKYANDIIDLLRKNNLIEE